MVDGQTPEHRYTISSPCGPYGSGELHVVTQTKPENIYLQLNKAKLQIPKPTFWKVYIIYFRCFCFIQNL